MAKTWSQYTLNINIKSVMLTIGTMKSQGIDGRTTLETKSSCLSIKLSEFNCKILI